MRPRISRLALLILAFCSVARGGESALDVRLTALAKEHKGKVAIAFKHLRTGEKFDLNADEPMPTASLIKLAVLIEAYQQAAEGKIKLSDPVTLRLEDKVPGAGVLTDHFTPGLKFPLHDALHLMIALSDNTATNLVLEQTGIHAVCKRMEDWGFPNTKINAKVFRGSTTSIAPDRTKRFGLGSTTAHEMVGVLEKLENKEILTPDACNEVLALLKKCDDHEKFPRFLPEGIAVAHKTGSVSDARTDAGIIYLPSGPVAVCVLTDKNEDQRWVVDNAGNLFCAKVAKEIYDHFASIPVAGVKAK
jgi:beta-lactamase class A